MLLEFIQSITSARVLTEGARIDHPEDLIFQEGIQGADRALKALAEIAQKPQNITIKFDGFPALVFGRNRDGQLIVADKHMFTKKDGSGRVTSLEQFVQYDVNRGANRGDLYAKLKILWPAFEQAVPRGMKGYYWGDLLWVGKLPVTNGMYVFKPNTVTYSVNARSQLGKRISTSVGGIVIHQYFPDFDQEPVVIQDTGQLNVNGPLAILTPNMQDQVSIKSPVAAIAKVNALIKQNADIISDLFHSDLLAAAKISDLGALMQKFVNARVKGFAGDFAAWLKTNVSANKLDNLLGEGGALTVQQPAVNAVFAIFQGIVAIKNNLIQQLDSQQNTIQSSINGSPGGEGYVFSTAQGLIKLVDRESFSAANFAKND
jgi:Family of unknown function (DUF6267)